MDQFYTLLQTNCITSTDISRTAANVFNNPSVCVVMYTLMMFRKSLKMIKGDRNMSDVQPIVCKI